LRAPARITISMFGAGASGRFSSFKEQSMRIEAFAIAAAAVTAAVANLCAPDRNSAFW